MSMTFRRPVLAMAGALLAVAFLLVPVSPTSAKPAIAETQVVFAGFDLCAHIPTQIGTAACNLTIGHDSIIPSPSDVLGAAGNAAGSVAESVGDTATMAFFRTLAKLIDVSVVSSLEGYATGMNERTTPSLGDPWYTSIYAVTYAVSIAAAILFGIMALIRSARDVDVGGALKAPVLIGVMIAAGGFVASVVDLGIYTFDYQLAPAVMKDLESEIRSAVQMLQEISLSEHRYDVVVVGPLVLGFFGAIGGVALEFVFWFRKFALYAVPIWWLWAFALYISGSEEGQAQFKKANYGAIGLISLKLLAAGMLRIGVNSMLSGGQSGDGFFVASFIMIATPFVIWSAIRALIKYDPQPTQKIKVITKIIKMVSP